MRKAARWVPSTQASVACFALHASFRAASCAWLLHVVLCVCVRSTKASVACSALSCVDCVMTDWSPWGAALNATCITHHSVYRGASNPQPTACIDNADSALRRLRVCKLELAGPGSVTSCHSNAQPGPSCNGLRLCLPPLHREWAETCHIRSRTGLSRVICTLHERLHRDWANPCHICAGTGLAASSTSALGLGSPLPHLHRDWAHRFHSCTAGLG
jgi:hypothetical protein